MNSGHIFISHASKDDDFVRELRTALEGQRLSVWVDSRNLRGGDKLEPEIEQAIERARQVIVVLSPNTVNSPWVRREIQKALKVEKERKDEGYRVIPLLLPGIEPSALELWFDQEPLGVRIYLKPGGLKEALPQVLAALGEHLPDDRQPLREVEARPVAELLLELTDPKIEEFEGKRRATATARLFYEPASQAARGARSKPFNFTAPLGPIESQDLCWYLESYYLWPTGVFKERADRIEAQLPQWGQDLYQAALGPQAAHEALTAWQQAADGAERRFSVMVESDLPECAKEGEQAASLEAASELLSLPWELLRDEGGYLCHGRHAVRVRRRLPSRIAQEVAVASLPIRVLLVSPRPEDENTGYIDHRISAMPLVEAVQGLGELVSLTVLTPPTFPALQEALKRAAEANEPFDVVHFDGHGVYDPKHGLGVLCFEDPKDIKKLHKRGMIPIHAKDMAAVIRGYRIPLVFLEACQTATAEVDPAASVAAKLLEEGVTSVVAMTHSVLVETARRFVKAFYEDLARGSRVGQAMLEGQSALIGDTYRGKIMGAGELHLRDWFVPVLYQEEHDPQLFTTIAPDEVRKLEQRQRKLSLGELPEPPPHTFIGRSRELLALERLLHKNQYAVVRGKGGEGKTTLAVELARWLVRTRRFERAAFVSMESYTDVRGVLDSLGHQLLPEGDKYSVAQFPDLKQARQPVERALSDHPTIIVLDNLETLLPDSTGQAPPEAAPVEELLGLCQALLDADSATRLLFTSREPLTEPFNHKPREIVLGALSQEDAIELVSMVMAKEGLEPAAADPGSTPQEITDLVEAVNRHARALVLLAGEVSRRGVRATTENLHRLMAELHGKYPDDREKSLYASVELSLRRLSKEARDRVKALGVFHGGAHLVVLADVLEVDEDKAEALATELIRVGLAEPMGYGHLRLDPSLPSYLSRETDEAEKRHLSESWARGMQALSAFLYEQRFKDAELAVRLTLLELPNLLALLVWMQENATAEEVADEATTVETLLARLARPQALAKAISVREWAVEKLDESKWSHTTFLAESASIDRLLEGAELPSAYQAAQKLLKRCLNEGEEAYKVADYDIALAHFLFGRAMKMMGARDAALQPLAEAKRRFEALVGAYGEDAERMASVAITETGDCLRALGRLDEAEAAYEEAIRRAERRDDKRSIAVAKGQLATVRMLQKRYDEALEGYIEAREIFGSLGEPRSVATAWHQIGRTYEEAGRLDQAEQAYRKSLAIEVQQRNRRGEADTLTQLGNLSGQMGRLEESVTFYQQAADIHVELQDQINEGKDRNNLAMNFISLQRYDEARRELQRAIECDKPFGHVAEPWKTWALLHDLERATGSPDAAAQAWQKAFLSYLDYRRDGGASQSPSGELCVRMARAIQEGRTEEARGLLAQASEIEDTPPWLKAMIPKLQAILDGSRDPALANDPDLDYDDAAELQLLLETLSS